jgi:transcriptional regulator with XRE-family HTH domain
MKGDLQRRVGAELRTRRKAAGLSQESLGRQIGMHRTVIGAMEGGERNITLQTLEVLAEKLGLEPADLIKPSGPLMSRLR